MKLIITITITMVFLNVAIIAQMPQNQHYKQQGGINNLKPSLPTMGVNPTALQPASLVPGVVIQMQPTIIKP